MSASESSNLDKVIINDKVRGALIGSALGDTIGLYTGWYLSRILESWFTFLRRIPHPPNGKEMLPNGAFFVS